MSLVWAGTLLIVATRWFADPLLTHSDLFGSFAEASCAALVVAGSTQNLVEAGWSALMYPVSISALGLFVCCLVGFVATHISPVRKEEDVEKDAEGGAEGGGGGR